MYFFSLSFWPAGSAEEAGELGSGPRRSSREETQSQADLLEPLVQFAPVDWQELSGFAQTTAKPSCYSQTCFFSFV